MGKPICHKWIKVAAGMLIILLFWLSMIADIKTMDFANGSAIGENVVKEYYNFKGMCMSCDARNLVLSVSDRSNTSCAAT